MADHFLHISDYSTDALWDILKLAKKLKQKFRNREEYKIFNNKSFFTVLIITFELIFNLNGYF